MDLNNKILEHDRHIMDLQEFVSEKNEVIRGRDKVVEVRIDKHYLKFKQIPKSRIMQVLTLKIYIDSLEYF